MNLYPTTTRVLDKVRWLLAYYDAEISINAGSTRDLARAYTDGISPYGNLTEQEVLHMIKDYWIDNDAEDEFKQRCTDHEFDPIDATSIWNEALTYKETLKEVTID